MLGYVIASAVCIALAPSVDSAQRPRSERRILEPGRPIRGEVGIGGQHHATFAIRVPDDAILIEVRLTDSPANLDLYMRHGSPIENPAEDAEHVAVSEESNETLQLRRWDQPPIRPGTYFVDVVCPLAQPPVIGKRRARTVPFEIAVEIVQARIEAILEAGKPIKSQTTKSSGYSRSFSIAVPNTATCLRLDLADVGGDLDLYVRRARPIIDLADADHESAGLQGRESLVIDAESDPPFRPGAYHITVVDEFGEEFDTPFTIHTSFRPEPPQELLGIPKFPAGKSPLQRALFATVELTGPMGGGSGTILTTDGLVLTNCHVVADTNGKPSADGDVIVAITLDERMPPTELFRAKVVEADKQLDLALIEIETGFYRQPLPPGYVFPAVPVGNPGRLEIGDRLSIIGYPWIGGTRSRPSITLTRGIVSGFELHRDGSLIKTDAPLYSGTSGGAALNEQCELVGVPSETVQDTEGAVGQVGYVRPLTFLPPAWQKRIHHRAQRKAPPADRSN